MEKFIAELEEQTDKMDKQIQALESQIGQAYDGMKGSKYHLHTLIIHDGSPMSGHYYAYIRDHSTPDKWYRFSDITVTEAKEEDVLKDAQGGSGVRSAYWAVYVDEQIQHSLARSKLYAYAGLNEQTQNLYRAGTPAHIQEKVNELNSSFVKAVEEDKAKDIVKKIHNLYEERFGELAHTEKENDKKAHYKVANIVTFLKSERKEEFAKLALLRICYREIT